MIDLLERAAADAPDVVAVRTPEADRTYAELLGAAAAVAGALRARGVERFAVVEPDAGVLLALLAGAARAGVEPCQYQPDLDAAQFAEQVSASGHEFVVTRRPDLGPDVLGGIEVLSPETLLAGTPYDGPAPGRQPLLIRTTGTTGLPKSASHDWRILARTVARVTPSPGEGWLLAYGPQQFAGTQVMLHALATHGTLVAPFPRQPRDGLAAILAGGVDCVSATPTYWRFLLSEARSAGAELPALQQITLGGEAAPGDLLAELRATFPDARISHVYASTEFGSIASVRDGLPGFDVGQLAGPDNPDGHLRVLDGQLWVRAGAGMLGYAGGEAAPTADGDWRATGDLVEIVEGRVLFRGRDSEVINVGGVKVSPLPVEERIHAVDGVQIARVFGRPNRLTGAIVATEIVLAPGADEDVVRAGVKAAVADLPRAWQPRNVNFVDTIETRGAKTVRRTEA